MGKGKCVSFEEDIGQTSSEFLAGSFKKMQIRKSIHNFPLFKSLKSPATTNMENISKSFSTIKIDKGLDRYSSYPVQRSVVHYSPKADNSMSNPCNNHIIFKEGESIKNIILVEKNE